ncbi:hypothetical protein M0R45_030601 [Rubus argutus]|uniref:Uncharacterized protein n=1 Tax=Rubus argutus TaxID=59490 RepID=A0AAW1WE52_RUBAR
MVAIHRLSVSHLYAVGNDPPDHHHTKSCTAQSPDHRLVLCRRRLLTCKFRKSIASRRYFPRHRSSTTSPKHHPSITVLQLYPKPGHHQFSR